MVCVNGDVCEFLFNQVLKFEGTEEIKREKEKKINELLLS